MHEKIMPTLQIRNLPQELYEKLKASALESKRSMTQEAILLLRRSLETSIEDRKDRITKLQALSDKLEKPEGANTEEITRWIREDRDR